MVELRNETRRPETRGDGDPVARVNRHRYIPLRHVQSDRRRDDQFNAGIGSAIGAPSHRSVQDLSTPAQAARVPRRDDLFRRAFRVARAERCLLQTGVFGCSLRSRLI